MRISAEHRNKQLVWDVWQRSNHADLETAERLASAVLHPEIAWFGPQPINELTGVEAVIEGYLRPLMRSFSGLRRDCDVFLASESCGEHWVSACGYLSGMFERDWLGIPSTGRRTHIHFGEHLRLDQGRVVESYLILDVLGVIRQAGFQLLPPARGAEGGRVIPPPRGEGVLLTAQDPIESAKSRDLVWAMIQTLERYAGDIASLEHRQYWHEQMHWYGPTGIGSCFNLEEYEEFHAGPWHRAFPDVIDVEAQGRSARLIGLENGEILAEGSYAALGVWDCPFSVSRDSFLGMPANGRLLTMRDFDWYRREGRYLVQNWVPIDIIDIALQLGVDLMAELERRKTEQEGSSADM